MTDQIPADKVEKIATAMRAAMRRVEDDYPDGEFLGDMGDYIRDLEALLPSRPTLADMNEEEWDACQWMQADLSDYGSRVVILNPGWDDESARVMWTHTRVGLVLHENITPRPDLPRMEWPGTEKPAPAPALPDGWRLADHQKYGRVMVTTQTPGSDGNVFFVLPSDGPLGYDWFFCTPAELTYIDQGVDTSDAVPESTLAMGSVWHDADALTAACEETGRDQIVVTDRADNVSMWDANTEYWNGPHPIQKYAPFTIIHTGKKAHQ